MTTHTTPSSSRISGFHKLDVPARVDAVARFADLDEADKTHLLNTGNLPIELASHLIENVIGTMNIPIGIATNMRINGRDRLIPMATEESSVVAAVCNAARQCYDQGGFITSMSGTEMIAQIQLTHVRDPQNARISILERKEEIRALCDACDPVLVKFGGGFRDLEVRVLETRGGPMVITHLIVDTRDAMGANAVNTMAEKIAPEIAAWTGGRTNLRILSNLADRRLARARCVWRTADIGGDEVRDAMLAAYQFAEADPYRAATHNKGIMNGISAVVLVTGNDTRAVEAGAHAYASRNGHYGSLTNWEITNDGDLAGSIEIPMAVGLIGGATKLHPTAKALALYTKARAAIKHIAFAYNLRGQITSPQCLDAIQTVLPPLPGTPCDTGVAQPRQSLHAPHEGALPSAGRREPRRLRRAEGIQYHSAYRPARATMAPTARFCHMFSLLPWPAPRGT
jgi:hydroxymethylglutaryl-CoA reductase